MVPSTRDQSVVRQEPHVPGPERRTLSGYGPEAAERSLLRRAVSDKVDSALGEETNEYEIVTLGRET